MALLLSPACFGILMRHLPSPLEPMVQVPDSNGIAVVTHPFFCNSAGSMMRHWLMKSEASEFSITDLARCPQQTTPWDGVRNYQARNLMRDAMQVGDLAFFYHSNATPPGIAGICEIASTAYPDPTAFDREHVHYDEKSTQKQPRWYLVNVRFKEAFSQLIALNTLRMQPSLSDMQVLRKGNRLSITPVTKTEWEHILTLA